MARSLPIYADAYVRVRWVRLRHVSTSDTPRGYMHRADVARVRVWSVCAGQPAWRGMCVLVRECTRRCTRSPKKLDISIEACGLQTQTLYFFVYFSSLALFKNETLKSNPGWENPKRPPQARVKGRFYTSATENPTPCGDNDAERHSLPRDDIYCRIIDLRT